MADVLPTSSNEAIELVRAQAPHYWRDAADLTIRGRVWLTMMEEYGMMDFNVDASYAGVWNVITRLPDVIPQGDSTEVVFEEHDSLDQLQVDLRGYRATDRLGHKNWLMNQGSKNRIINLYDHKSTQLLKAMRKMVGADFFIDGYATGNSNRYIGINSFTGVDLGNTVVGDRVATPSDTYGNRSTVLGNYGGSWSTDLAAADRYNTYLANDWPDGQGAEQYDSFTFLPVNYTSTGWTSGNTWRTNCEEVLRFTIDVQANRGAVLADSNAPELFLCGRRMFTDLKEYFSARNQIMQPVQEAIDLGFPEVLNFEGTWIAFDYDCPVDEGYLMNPGAMEYFSPQSDLFDVFGPEWSLPDMSFLYLVSNYANFRFQPKLFAKVAPYVSA